MSLYGRVIKDIRKENASTDLYRFQGGNSMEYYDIKRVAFLEESRESYVYLSQALDHHKYFTIKRIRQLLNNVVLYNTEFQVMRKQLQDIKCYKEIKKIVLNSDKIPNLYSVQLICDNNATTLLKENSFSRKAKDNERVLEKVDSRFYGGGFGVTSEWKELLECLTFFNGYHRIDREDILFLLTSMRTMNRVNGKDGINISPDNQNYYSFGISPRLESNFTKYAIMDSLERICENKLYSPKGTLAKEPIKTIKKVVEDYEKRRDKILTLVDKNYNSLIKERQKKL